MGYSLAEVKEATGGKIIHGPESLCCSGVAIDSRLAAPGDLFIAILGQRFDGHRFIPDAVAAGAHAVVAAKGIELPPGVGLVLVDDTTAALGAVARLHRQRFTLPVVAVTGSNGKTGVKEMIASIGSVRRQVAKTSGNQNNEIGLPLTLLNLTASDELLVVEMGMRGSGQIAALSEVALPVIGVVTNIGLTHLELLGTRDAIAAAKGELIAALPAQGAAILNADDARCLALAARTKARVLTFGFSPRADIRAVDADQSGEGTSFKIIAPGWSPVDVSLAAPGHHQIMNALAAAAVAHALGYPPDDVRAGLNNRGAERGRGAILANGRGWRIIDDTYNASPASVEAALNVLATLPGNGRRIAVLADMLELGTAALDSHRKIGEIAVKTGVSILLTTGGLAEEILKGAVSTGFPATMARHYPDKTKLLSDLRALLHQDDIVLVKGSRGMRMETIVEGLLS